MTCPHCERNLLRKERTGNICSHCRRAYALDPKTNSLRLNDLRVRRIATGLTDDGRIHVTPGQLWYALSRKRIRDGDYDPGCAGGAIVFAVISAFVAGFGGLPFWWYVSGVLLAIGFGNLIAHAMGAGRGRAPLPRSLFRDAALVPWVRVYGTLPPGVVDDIGDPWPQRPADAPPPNAVLVCPDPSITAFLTADGLPERHGIAMVEGPEHVRSSLLSALPPRGPVLVLHDADARGELLVQHLRANLPGRPVVDAGLSLRTVRAQPKAVAYRDPLHKPSPEEMRQLGALGTFTPEELKWLARGWRFPLVGVPPVKLLAVVDRLAGQAARGGDAERRRATEVGFMTWPGAAPDGTDPEDASR
ncbi:hypothetical protein ACIGFK_16965 [Streptomyces sp. NPDC085524]|uniref:hypothetical protein n=1 Tax=Streptomyces sp. NPDC085524 TaxID=3365728 RepID=UPI0037CE250D